MDLDSLVNLAATNGASDLHLEAGLPAALRPHVAMKYYDAGHMMYLREQDLAKLNSKVENFIQSNSAH
jgi:Tfp pilus assembly pilus retraction ATPase PilT